MSNKKKILFIDLLHVVGGSLDDDIHSIDRAMSVDYKTKYIKVSSDSGLFDTLKVYIDVFPFYPSKIVFLSSRVNQLFLFLPLRLFFKCYFIYHFMPNHRIKFHSYALPLLAKFYKLGVYSKGVSNILFKLLGFAPDILPSRIIDAELSFRKLRKKIFYNHVDLLIPGVKPGVRNPIDLPTILAKINNLGVDVDTVYIQSKDKFPEYNLEGYTLNIKKFGYIELSDYLNIFSESLFIVVDFDESYEVRASGVILDALNSGTIVITNDHPIVFQYGYPNTTVTNLENVHKIISKIKNSNKNDGLIEVYNFEDFRRIWNTFLN
jgi:hypothetical protein